MTTKEILETYHTIAVVGLSSNRWRASYSVSKFMQNAGYRIIPVNPNEVEAMLGTIRRIRDESETTIVVVERFGAIVRMT